MRDANMYKVHNIYRAIISRCSFQLWWKVLFVLPGTKFTLSWKLFNFAKESVLFLDLGRWCCRQGVIWFVIWRVSNGKLVSFCQRTGTKIEQDCPSIVDFLVTSTRKV